MSLKQALMNSQEISESEATQRIREMRQLVWDGEDPEEVLYEEGLEPDYVPDLLF